jgi:hypothetical protein
LEKKSKENFYFQNMYSFGRWSQIISVSQLI